MNHQIYSHNSQMTDFKKISLLRSLGNLQYRMIRYHIFNASLHWHVIKLAKIITKSTLSRNAFAEKESYRTFFIF